MSLSGEAMSFNGVKVFSVTRAKDRDYLSDDITRWLKDNPAIEIVDKEVVQSSDSEFHCLSVVLFYNTSDK